MNRGTERLTVSWITSLAIRRAAWLGVLSFFGSKPGCSNQKLFKSKTAKLFPDFTQELPQRGRFLLDRKRTNGKARNSLQSEKVVQWTVFDKRSC
jgi:hypothetical protein